MVPSSQIAPLHPSGQVQLFGEEHTPPFSQLGEQMATCEGGRERGERREGTGREGEAEGEREGEKREILGEGKSDREGEREG